MKSNDLAQYVKMAKNQFINCKYLKNSKIHIDTTHDISIIGYFIDRLDIDVPPRLKGWVENNLIACWGNTKVKCVGESDKIFEVLNLIMEKLKVG